MEGSWTRLELSWKLSLHLREVHLWKEYNEANLTRKNICGDAWIFPRNEWILFIQVLRSISHLVNSIMEQAKNKKQNKCAVLNYWFSFIINTILELAIETLIYSNASRGGLHKDRSPRNLGSKIYFKWSLVLDSKWNLGLKFKLSN